MSKQLTHFLSIPLHNSPTLKSRLSQFRSEILQADPSIPTDAIRDVKTIHLTIGVMSLHSKEQLDKAVEALQSLHSLRGMVLPSEPLYIRLEGLACMRGHSPSEAGVVYAVPEGDDVAKLQEYANRIYKYFVQQNLIQEKKRNYLDQSDDVLLHATLLNTVYATRKGRRNLTSGQKTISKQNGSGSSRHVAPSIDATAMLEKYKDFVFMDSQQVEHLHICRMGELKGHEGGGYMSIASIQL